MNKKIVPLYIPLGNGQALMPEVMEGILKQTVKCMIVPITSDKTDNKEDCSGNLNNWITILELAKKPFIGMDSDVVMTDPKTIETLLSIPDDIDIASIMTRKEHHDISQSNRKLFHGLFYCRVPERILTWFKIFKKDNYKGCCWCEAINALVEKGRKYRVFKEPKATECKRIEL